MGKGPQRESRPRSGMVFLWQKGEKISRRRCEKVKEMGKERRSKGTTRYYKGGKHMIKGRYRETHHATER